MEVGRCIKSVIRGQRHWCGVVAIGLPLIRRGGEKALIDPPRSGKMTVIRRRFGRFGSVGGGRATSLRLGWATGCPMPSGAIMPPYAEIGAVCDRPRVACMYRAAVEPTHG